MNVQRTNARTANRRITCVVEGKNWIIATERQSNSKYRSAIPGNNDEEIEPIPRVAEIGSSAEQAHGDHLDAHLGGEEDEDGVVERLEHATTQRRTDHVLARLEHAERHAVEQDDGHADSLEPRAGRLLSRLS